MASNHSFVARCGFVVASLACFPCRESPLWPQGIETQLCAVEMRREGKFAEAQLTDTAGFRDGGVPWISPVLRRLSLFLNPCCLQFSLSVCSSLFRFRSPSLSLSLFLSHALTVTKRTFLLLQKPGSMAPTQNAINDRSDPSTLRLTPQKLR